MPLPTAEHTQAPLWPGDYSAGNEGGSRHVGLDRSRSIGRPTTDPVSCTPAVHPVV